VWLRYFLRREERQTALIVPTAPRTENESAFLAASMQGVIQRLKEQEKELERLHRQEKERAQQTERLSAAVTRNMPTGLLLLNAAELITMSNPAAETALGVGALAYRRYSEVLGAQSDLTRLLTACLREARTFQREEVDHLTPQGDRRRLGLTISPVFQPPGDPAGKVTGAVCLLSDLTELTALQKQMRLRENLAALGEMSAGIAHEFKNALATISGYAQMIRSEAREPELAESAAKILKETQSLTHVVTEFLRYSRPIELASSEVTLAPLVERVVAEASQAMPGVTFATAGEFRVVDGDEGLLRQVLLNLARNAAESVTAAGVAGGRVTISGAVEQDGGEPMQRIAVADNGPGIAPDALAKIFLPFYTTKVDGTGLGLALVQKIVLLHGGTIQVRNLAPGAEFIVKLPLPRVRA
jgi:signal transduction histidine kinase